MLARKAADRAGWALAVELLQLASSTVVFLILVKFMEPETFGELSGVMAMTFPALAVATVGTHFLLLRRSAQGENLHQAWNRAITVGMCGPVLAAAVMIGLQPLILPNIDPWAYALIFVGNLPFFWMNELAVYLGIGTGQMRRAAQVRGLLVGFRFLAVLWFAIWGGGSLVAWAAANMVSFIAGAIGALWFVNRVFGLRPRFDRRAGEDLSPGIPFSVNSVNEGMVDSSDRVLLLRFDHKVDAGLYSLGARIVQFGYLPLRMLLRSYDADLFGAGKHGVRAALVVTRRMAVTGMALSVAMTAGLVVFAPLVPLVAGEKYDDALDVIRWLALLPVVRMVQYLFGNVLSAADRQWWRTGATALAMVTNLGLNIWLLRDGGWRTAVLTTFVAEVLLALALIAAVFYWSRRERLERPSRIEESTPTP